MRPWLTVGALALAGHRANAVGAVRITLTPDGLEVELMRVAAFAQGFAPGEVADPVVFRVPYTAVRGLVRDRRVLYLGFDPAVVTPFNRFALAGFTLDPEEATAHTFRDRARATWASYLLPAPLGAVLGALVPAALVGGVLGRASVGVLSALVLFAALGELAARRTWGGPASDALRDRFEAELSEQLALAPPPAAEPRTTGTPGPARPSPVLARRMSVRRPRPRPPPPVPAPARPAASAAPEAAGRLGWPLAAVGAAALAVVGGMALLQRWATPRRAPPPAPLAVAGLGAAVRSVRIDVRPPPEPPRCVCTRADSPLWKDGIPALAVLTFHGEDEVAGDLAATPDRAGFPQFDFDLAVVNDGARPVRDVRLTLTFWRNGKAGKKVGAVDRGLFWGGLLAPGAAVKWRVSAPGSDVRLDASVTGTLEQARVDPAPADAFAKLLGSRFRAVRAHGAEMLAYLRDPRADEAARALSATSAADDPLLARIRRAAAPVLLCELNRTPGHVEACVFNASSLPRSGLSLREVTAPGVAARSVPVETPVPVHEGRRVNVAVPEDFGEEVGVGE